MKALTDDELLLLQAQAAQPPDNDGRPVVSKEWLPSLLPGQDGKPGQMDVFFDRTDSLLVDGPRYSGKGWCCGYAVVKHCWDFHNALALIVVRTKRQGSVGGIFSKIGNDILPDFKENLEGFDFIGPSVTTEKDIIYKVRNRFGTWSVIQMMSIQHDSEFEKKIKGLEASLVYLDEGTLFDNKDAFTYLRGTLKRRRFIPAEDQRFIVTCNPKGPSHWIYGKFIETPEDQKAFFRRIFLPIEQNPDPIAQQYLAALKRDNAHDPIAIARDVEGLWVERSSGEAIFLDYWDKNIHVRGDFLKKEFLHPKPGLMVSLGWDLGDANHSIIFQQERPTRDKVIQMPFDEIVYTDSKLDYGRLVPEIMERMNWWCDQEDYDFQFLHISDKSAFDRFRAATGSYDHRQVQQISKSELEKHSSRYPRLSKPIRLVACPKPPGSVAARVRHTMALMGRGELIVSAKCVRLIDAFANLESEKGEPFEPRRSQHLHPYDAFSYVQYYFTMGGSVVARPEDALKPEFMQVGEAINS